MPSCHRAADLSSAAAAAASGAFGLVELLNPALLTTYLGKPEASPYMMSDLYVGSVASGPSFVDAPSAVTVCCWVLSISRNEEL